MTIGFLITDYQSAEQAFSIPCRFGTWEFQKNVGYQALIPKLQSGMVGNTYSAFNSAVDHFISEANLATIYQDLRDICLLLSFHSSLCVTPSGSTQDSEFQHLSLGDKFIPPRAIRGFPILEPFGSIAPFLQKGLALFRGPLRANNP